MEDGDTEKYHPSRVIQDFVFLSRKRCFIRFITLQDYNILLYTAFISIYESIIGLLSKLWIQIE